MRSTVTISLAAIAAASCLAACSPAARRDGTEGTAIQSHPYAQISGEAVTGRTEDIADTLYDQDGPAIRVLYRLKVDYVEDGQRHWDYVHADMFVKVVLPKTDPKLIQPPC